MSRRAAQGRGRKRAGSNKTESELLFEKYLKEQAEVCFEYEPSIPGKKRKPDYHVRWSDHKVIVEVKELHARRALPTGAASFDPYGHIRKAIEKAREKFREYKEHCCVLLIHNVDDWEFRDSPDVVLGAMLGDFGMRIPFDPKRGELLADGAHSAFLERGKMVAPKSREPQNRTISAIVILSDFTIPNPEFKQEYERRVEQRRREIKGDLPVEESVRIRMDLYKDLRPTLGQALQLKVFENPLASIELEEAVFKGDYDARYRFNNRLGKIERTFAGQRLWEAEQVTEAESDISSRIDRFTQGIVDSFSPERIVLFGSYAYGCPESGSDVDILVIFPGDGSAADRSLEIRQRLNPDFPLDLLARSAGEVERRIELGDPFMQEVLGKGKTLYSRKVVA
jgi:predicted nucleotidyltransferase